ncbi:MAG: hypothetical protein WBE77_11125, partial [Candidatus Cybelea sp.]
RVDTAVVVVAISEVPFEAEDIRRRKSRPDIPSTLGKLSTPFSGNGSVTFRVRATVSAVKAKIIAMA